LNIKELRWSFPKDMCRHSGGQELRLTCTTWQFGW